MLIVLAGLPGTGKTMLVRALAARLNAMHLRVDTIEQALRSCDALGSDIGPAGYLAAYGIAQDNLRLGETVVADAVNPLQVTRNAWRSVARRCLCRIVEVEVICSDKAEHRRRVETRVSDVDGLRLPTWRDVVARTYEAWDRPPIIIDTASKDLDGTVAELMARLDGRR